MSARPSNKTNYRCRTLIVRWRAKIGMRCAMSGGEDYELLFCAPPRRRKRIEKLNRLAGVASHGSAYARRLATVSTWSTPAAPLSQSKQRATTISKNRSLAPKEPLVCLLAYHDRRDCRLNHGRRGTGKTSRTRAAGQGHYRSARCSDCAICLLKTSVLPRSTIIALCVKVFPKWSWVRANKPKISRPSCGSCSGVKQCSDHQIT